MQRIILASASPRRAELLRAAGIEFDVIPADADESPKVGEAPGAYARRVAESKATAVAPRANGRFVLAADTVVVDDGTMLGKPRDPVDAARMLRRLSGRAHDVVTAVALLTPGGLASHVESTRVELSSLTENDIAWYVSTGEPSDKAGAYAIQGYASRFVTRISGSYSNVVGLPVHVVWALLSRESEAPPRSIRGSV